MYKFPENPLRIRSKHRVIVDLPAPVLPTTPIFSFGYMIKLIFLRADGKFGRYLTLKSLNSTIPLNSTYSSTELSTTSSGSIIVIKRQFSKATKLS